MRKIRSILLALAMVLTLLPVSAFAVGTDRTEDLAALEEQMRQELFSADDRIYAEDYEAPEAPDPDEIIRVLVETRSAPALEIASTQGAANMQAAEVTALKGQESTIQAAKRQLGLEPSHRLPGEHGFLRHSPGRSGNPGEAARRPVCDGSHAVPGGHVLCQGNVSGL